MSIDLDTLPLQAQFAYIAMTKTAIFIKEIGKDKDYFLDFCGEIWNSMEMSDLDTLKDVLQEKMKRDLNTHLKSYMRNKDK